MLCGCDGDDGKDDDDMDTTFLLLYTPHALYKLGGEEERMFSFYTAAAVVLSAEPIPSRCFLSSSLPRSRPRGKVFAACRANGSFPTISSSKVSPPTEKSDLDGAAAAVV